MAHSLESGGAGSGGTVIAASSSLAGGRIIGEVWPIANLEFAVNLGKVVFDGAVRDPEGGGDLLVAHAPHREEGDLDLAGRQAAPVSRPAGSHVRRPPDRRYCRRRPGDGSRSPGRRT